MGKRNPQPLNRFPEIDLRVLQRVADTGRLDITFDTPNQAYNTKFRLLRLIKSLEFFKPEDPLSRVAVLMTLKIKDCNVTILRKDQSTEANAMEAALGGAFLGRSADTVEAEQSLKRDDADMLELEANGLVRWDHPKSNPSGPKRWVDAETGE
jgi:hypothetical protein